MLHVLVILLAPILATLPISIMVGAARSRFAVVCGLLVYIVVTVIGPFVYGWLLAPEIRNDWTAVASLAALIVLQRFLELRRTDLGILFKEKWRHP